MGLSLDLIKHDRTDNPMRPNGGTEATITS
jgi:hypothetical protein